MIDAMAAWRARPAQQVLADLAAYGAGAPMDDCPALARLFAPGAAGAAGFAGGFIDAMLAVLAAEPLGHPACPHFTNGATSSLMLGQAERASLSMLMFAGQSPAQNGARPATVSFVPALFHEAVLAGGQHLALHRRERGDGADQFALTRREVAMRPGDVLVRNGAIEGEQRVAVDGRVVILRLQRRDDGHAPVEEVALATGRVVHRATADAADSRRELMAAVLGRMGRRDAAPLLARIAGAEGSTGMRWQLLREALALDAGEGFAALSAIACSPTDPLAAPAGALRAQLVEAHPALKALEPCPA